MSATGEEVETEKDDNPWWKDEGDDIIRAAAIEAGADKNKLKIDWGPGYITVTVGGEASLSTSSADDDDDEDEDEEGVELDPDEDYEEDEEEDILPLEENKSNGPDITAIARAINKALDGEEGSVGMTVATLHSIDVTTPGASDELSGIMFESYKGFDIILDFFDKKKNKKVEFEGKLVERTDDVTIINMKGRMKKLKNELVSSIRLPKAKREKGV